MSKEAKSTLFYMVTCFVFCLIGGLAFGDFFGLTPLWALIGAMSIALLCGFGEHFEHVWFPRIVGWPTSEELEEKHKEMLDLVIDDIEELEAYISKVLDNYPEIGKMDITQKETHQIIYGKIFQDYGKMVANIKMIKKILKRQSK